LLSKNRATQNDVIFQDGGLDRNSGSITVMSRKKQYDENDVVGCYIFSHLFIATTNEANATTRHRPTSSDTGNEHSGRQTGSIPVDVSRSCVGFVDPRNIDVAVGILLLGGLKLKMTLGYHYPPPVHCERDFNSVHGRSLMMCQVKSTLYIAGAADRSQQTH